MEDGLPVFDYDKCTSCGACVAACPRNLIELIPFKNEAMLVVACNNRDPARVVRQICKVGCIGCGACARKSDAFYMSRDLAHIDYDKYTNIEALRPAIERCPIDVMVVAGPGGSVPAKQILAEPVHD
jgi:ferredoxin